MILTKIDVVIAAHSKDKDTLDLCIKYAKNNVINVNNIYVVSKTKLSDNAIWIPENTIPYSFEKLEKKIGKHKRTGWYYAGIIHMSCLFFIPNILDNIVIIDSDTLVLKPTKFIDNGIGLFNISPTDGTPVYYEHAFKLIPELNKQHSWSGVCHHIVMNKDILLDLYKKIENIHNKNFIEAYIDVTLEPYKCLNEKTYSDVLGKHENGPGRLTSYELYFTFALQYHKDKVRIRKLNSILAYKGRIGAPGCNLDNINRNYSSNTNLNGRVQIIPREIETKFNFESIPEAIDYIANMCKNKNYDMVSFHNHCRWKKIPI